MSTILFYDVVLFVHILAVVLAFGVVFTYPLLDAHMRKSHPGDLAALHRMQVFLTRHLISPMMIVVLAAGLYLALDRWELDQGWIVATLVILFVLFGLSGGVFTPLEKHLAQLAERDARAGGARSAEYEQQAKKLAMFGSLAGLLIIVAVFLMTVKPGV